MITRFLFISLLVLLSFGAQGQTSLTPSQWQGQIGSVRLILVIDATVASHSPTGHFESPDQTEEHIPITDLRITADSLIATAPLIGGTFSSRFSPDQRSLVGVWQQGNASLPLTLRRLEKPVVKSKRPQTPVPPFPYRSDSVQYYNADKSIHFGATLTYPNPSHQPTRVGLPAVILITGSGPQDRDETVFRHKPFAVIADHLTRHGFAVLRVDDRGVGQTTGSFRQATSADFANDVLASIAYLKTRSDIDAKKIGLIGHSDGGLVAPLVAVRSSDVAYIVSLAGVGVKGSELLKKQIATSNRLEGMSPSAQVATAQVMNALIDRAADTALSTTRADLQAVYGHWKQTQPVDSLTSTGLTDQSAKAFISSLLSPWMQYFLRYDPAPTLRKIRIPLLAMNGEKDYQVDATDNLSGFTTNLKKAGNKRYQIVSMPGLNHLFQTASTGGESEYAQLEETFSPRALTKMTEWLKEQVGIKR
ncbi:MAG: alpha/beta fold hydrolase [Bacteroidetes bacterium]|nr:alpha/beta fold hydrolase [Fibrella sp.]